MDQKTLQKHMETLGVKKGACTKTIRAAWRAKVKATHPDRNPHAQPHEIIAVNEAFEALKDGLPQDKPVEKSPTQSARPAEPAPKPAPKPSAEPARYILQPGYQDHIRFDAKAQAAMADLATQYVTSLQFPLPERTLRQKLFGKPASYPIRTPREYTCQRGTIFIELDCRKLPAGTSYLALPFLVIEDGRLKATDDVAIYRKIMSEEAPLQPKLFPGIAEMILPKGVAHYQVYLMTRMNLELH